MVKSFLTYSTVFALIMFFLLPLKALAQNIAIDSLEDVLSKSKEDTNRVNTLMELAYVYSEIEAQKTLAYSKQGYGVAMKIGFVKGQARSIRNIGLGYYKMGNYDTAIVLCRRAIEIAEKEGLLRIKADALNTIGNTYYKRGNHYKAVEAYEEILPIYEGLGRRIDRAGTISNIGSIWNSQGKYPEALKNFQEALSLFEELDHVYGKANVQHNIANLYESQKEFDKALVFYLKTAKNDSISGNKSGRASTLSNVAEVYTHLGDTVKAIESYHQSIALFKESNTGCGANIAQTRLGRLYLSTNQIDSAYFYITTAYEISKNCESRTAMVQSLTDLGRYYQKVGDVKQAKKNFLGAYELASEMDLKPTIASAAEQLYLLNRQSNNYSDALKYFEIKEEIDEELFNEDNTRELTRLEAAYEFEKEKQRIEYDQELEIIQYNEKLENQRIVQMIVIVGLVIMSILAVIITRLYLNKRKVNKKLGFTNGEVLEQNAEIQAQNEEITQQRDQLEERSRVVEEQKLELLKKNEELIELDQEKNALIGIVAHDLKSPINQIRGMVNVAKLSYDSLPKELQEYLMQIERSSNRSVEMIDRVLDINAIENRQLDLKMERVKLVDVLHGTCQSIKLLADTKNIAVHCIYTENDTYVMADKNLLREVFENLISNAIKFSEKGKSIFLELVDSGEYVQTKVRDEGPGISTEDQKILFNKYQRLSAKPTAGEKSTGLGLAIVKRFTEEMNGSVWCESELGQGATFIVQLNKLT